MQSDKVPCSRLLHSHDEPSFRRIRSGSHGEDSQAASLDAFSERARVGARLPGCALETESPSSPCFGATHSRRKIMCPSHGEMPSTQLVNAEIQKACAMSRSCVTSGSDDSRSDATLGHWWEAPPGGGSRGRAVTCTFPLEQDASHSSSKSDVTAEIGTACNANYHALSSESTQNNSSTPCRTHASDTERTCISSNEVIPDTTASSRVDNCVVQERVNADVVESQSCCGSHKKEKRNKWSEEEGKMVITEDVFNAVLPSADEVGLQWRISELRVALRASESARQESEQEMLALRKYLAEVETAAASLQSHAQELEHLIAFSCKDETRELDQLRAKIAMETSREARNQAITAAQAVAAAREATMELDKVKRHASALIQAQEEEIERLSMEAAECRALYHAKSGQLQATKDRLERLEQSIKHQAKCGEDALQVSRAELMDLQRKFELATEEKETQYTSLLEAYDFAKCAMQSTETRLEEVEREKKDLLRHNELLKQQVTDLQNQGVASRVVHYDHELCKVRALLGSEKTRLFAELAMLRHGNQTLHGEIVQWQEKFHALSRSVSSLDPMPSAHELIASTSAHKIQPTRTPDFSAVNLAEADPSAGSYEDEPNQCNLCILEREAAKAGNSVDGKIADNQSSSLTLEKDNCRVSCKINPDGSSQENPESVYVNCVHNIDGNLGQVFHNNRDTGAQDVHCNREMNVLVPDENTNSCHKTSCIVFRDNLLSAAHREIVKLKEINQCLVAACQNDIKLTNE